MKRFVLYLLLVYTIITILLVSGIIFIDEHDQRERNCPRKMLYVVNLTNDTLSVHFTGTYTKDEKQAMTDKPDSYDLDFDPQTIPYQQRANVEYRAASFRIPHKYDKEIAFPGNFTLHIRNQGKNQVFSRPVKANPCDTWWIIYIYPEWINPEATSYPFYF